MSAPSIQYAMTSDGVSIAYAVQGAGAAFISMPPIPFAFTAGHEQVPEWHAWNQQIASRGTLIRYDCRGAGLSDRDVSDYSLDAWLSDLEAVVESLQLDRFAIFAPSGLAVPVAIAYAARWREKVSHLILWQAYATTASLYEQPGFAAVMNLLNQDWQLFTETMAHSVEGWSEPETARRSAALIRENHDAVGIQAAVARSSAFDVTDLLPAVSAPTLILHRRESAHDLRLSKAVAAKIPNAQLIVVEGNAASFALQHPDAVLRAIDDFMAGDKTRQQALTSGITAILFVDIADSTALTEHLGDAAFRAKARALEAGLRAAVRDNGGAVVDATTLGDGILGTFPAASQGIAAALACGEAGDQHGLPLHLGLHAGDVIRESDNVFGGAVNIAARISAMAAPGELLVSDIVRGLARTSAGVAFEDRGEQVFKGVVEPVRVYAVHARA